MKFNSIKKIINTIRTVPGAAFCVGTFSGATLSCLTAWFRKKIYEEGYHDGLKEARQKIDLYTKGVFDTVTVTLNTDPEEQEKGPNTPDEEPCIKSVNEKKKNKAAK